MPVRQIDDPLNDFGGKQPGWKAAEWGVDGGKFGRTVGVAHYDLNGNYTHDRHMVEEGPHAIAIAFGVPEDGVPRILLVKEQRDGVAPLDGESVAWFWGPPRGFAEPADVPAGAAAAVAKKIVVRETAEEGGYTVLAGSVTQIPSMYVNETCVRTASPLAIVQVDMAGYVGIKEQRDEWIASADFFTLDQAKQMILAGEYDGACTTSGVLATAVLQFEMRVIPVYGRRKARSKIKQIAVA